MYQRNYPQNDTLPPNYKGNAFDKTPATVREEEERLPDKCEICDKCEGCDRQEKQEKNEEKGLLSSIFTRRDGSSFQLDDIILGALIIMLLNSHADDELLLILVLLFISGI